MRFIKLQSIALDEDRRPLLGYLAAGVICALGLAVVAAITPYLPHRFTPARYIPIHTVLEFISIVVSFAVFATGWYGYRQTKNPQDLLVAVAFMMVGTIDFVHTLSYKGMPNFLGTNTVGKAAAYWLAARLVGAVALLAVAFVNPAYKGRWSKRGFLLPVAAVVSLGLIGIVSVYGKAASDLMYYEGNLTPLKIALEYTVVGLHIAAFWAFGRSNAWRPESVHLLRAALIFAIGSEVCFTLYRSAYDAYNLLGHIYKVAAYYLVLDALFVSSLRRPYQELSRTKKQLQDSFARIGEALASSLNKEPTLSLIVSLARQMFDADGAAIGELGRGGIIDISTFDGINPGRMRTPVYGTITEEALATGEPVLVGDIRTYPNVRPELLQLGIRSLLSAPIQRGGSSVGAIYVVSKMAGRFTKADADTLTAFARHAAIAIANAEHYEKEHHIAESLQEVIFPPSGLEFGEFSIAGKYQSAWNEARVGGDFYDYFDLGNGRLGIAIGDVSGKGLDAAVHTAIVKYSYQAYVREGFGPAESLRRIDEAFGKHKMRSSISDHVFITQFCGILDTKTGRFTYSNAGHEPPVQMTEAGETRILSVTGPIIGIEGGETISEEDTTLEPGDILVLHTDGITEARANGVLFGQDGLINAMRSCRGCSAKEIAERIYEQAMAHANGQIQDDIALVVIRRSG